MAKTTSTGRRHRWRGDNVLVVALRWTAIDRDFSLGKVFLFHRRSLYDMVIYTIDGVILESTQILKTSAS